MEKRTAKFDPEDIKRAEEVVEKAFPKGMALVSIRFKGEDDS